VTVYKKFVTDFLSYICIPRKSQVDIDIILDADVKKRVEKLIISEYEPKKCKTTESKLKNNT